LIRFKFSSKKCCRLKILKFIFSLSFLLRWLSIMSYIRLMRI